MWCALVTSLLCIFLSSSEGSPSFQGCTSTEMMAACAAASFGNASRCVVLPTSNTSLSLSSSCTSAEAICELENYRSLAACLGQCLPFASEESCLGNMVLGNALGDVCGAKIASVCSSAFNFPRRNCTELPVAFAQRRLCPSTNALIMCIASCTGRAAAWKQYALDGLVQGNPYNKVLEIENVANLTSLDSLMAAANLFLRDVAIILVSNGISLFETFYDTVIRTNGNVFFFVSLDVEPSRPLPYYADRSMFAVSPSELFAFVAGYSLAAQSLTHTLLFVSPSGVPTPPVKRFVSGFSQGARQYNPSIRVYWSMSTSESYRAVTELAVDGVGSSAVPSLIFPLLKRAWGIGVFTDYSSDVNTFKGMNTTESRNLLFSVIGTSATIRAGFVAASLGNFRRGVSTGDAINIALSGCGYACARIRPETLRAMQTSFRAVHQIGALVISPMDVVSGDVVRTFTNVASASPLSTFGVPYSFSSHSPRPVAVFRDTLVLVDLADTKQAVWTMSLAVSQLQPMSMASNDSAPSRRGRYSLASSTWDESNASLFVVQGVHEESGYFLDEVWSLQISSRMQLIQRWALLFNNTKGSLVASPGPRVGHSAVYLQSSLFVFGGTRFPATASTHNIGLDVMHVFDLGTNSWRRGVAKAPVNRSGHAALVLEPPLPEVLQAAFPRCEQWIVFVGGVTETTFGEGISLYCPQLDLWRVAQSRGAATTQFNARVMPFCAAWLMTPTGRLAMIVAGGHSGAPTVAVDVHSLLKSEGAASFTFEAEVLGDVANNNGPLGVGEGSNITCAEAIPSNLANSGRSMVVASVTPSSRTLPITNNALYYFLPQNATCEERSEWHRSSMGFGCSLCPPQTLSDASGNLCIPCSPDDTWNERCATSGANASLIGVLVAVGAALILLGIPLSIQGARSFQRLKVQRENIHIAMALSESITTLEFGGLHFLATLQNPTRLQKAFITILKVLVTYLQFIPMWAISGTRSRSDRAGGVGDEVEHDADNSSMSEGPSEPVQVQVHASTADCDETHKQQQPRGRNLESRLERSSLKFQQRLFTGTVTVLYMTIDGLEHHFSDRMVNRRGAVVTDLNGRKLSELSAALAARIDKFGGLLDSQLGNCIFVTFNSLRLNSEHELSAVLTALAVKLYVEHVSKRTESTPSVGDERGLEGPRRPMRLSCGIASGEALIGVVGRNYGRFPTVVGPIVKQSVKLCGVARSTNKCSILLPFTSMKMSLAVKVAVKVVGQIAFEGGNNSATANQVLIAEAVGRRRDIGAPTCNSLDVRNTLLEYVFNGAVSAVRQQMGNSADCPPTTARATLCESDAAAVEEAIAVGAVPAFPQVSMRSEQQA